MIRISIVIPVYNVQECLAYCVESVINQTYPKDHLQIILVDDGSTDESGTLCDSFSEKYDYVEVYHKENGGLSDARNYGLVHANGDYVLFLDSDDYLGETACFDFSEAISAQEVFPDVVTGTTIKHIGSNELAIVRSTAGMPLMSGEQFLLHELKGGRLFVAAWASIYRTSFLKEQDLFFWKGIIHEDEDFTPRALLKARAVLSMDIEFYHYVIRDNSITTKKDRTQNAICIFEIGKKLTPCFDQLQNRELKALLKSHLAKIMLKAICDGELYKKQKRNLIDYQILKQNCVHFYEKARYLILRINPKLLYLITNRRRR